MTRRPTSFVWPGAARSQRSDRPSNVALRAPQPRRTSPPDPEKIEALEALTAEARRNYIAACNQMVALREEAEGRDGAARTMRNTRLAAYEALKERLRAARHT